MICCALFVALDGQVTAFVYCLGYEPHLTTITRMSNDPTSLLFPDSDGSVDLYSVLDVSSAASNGEIKSAYRKLALKHHPDKHATASEETKASASATFQQIGFAYAVLSDAARRKRYDATGSADPGVEDLVDGDNGWERYFQEMFDTVTRERLDEMRQAYQGV
jgi:DnaJ family protein C protein 9